MKEEWTSPEVEEFEIAERTQLGDGTTRDNLDFEIGGDSGGDTGGGAAPSS
jgi:hypothetical protein